MRIHHFQVVVPRGRTGDVTAFYDLLGLQRTDKPEADGIQKVGAWYDVPGGGQVHISERDSVGVADSDRHFGLVLDDYDLVVARLHEAGYEIQDRPAVLGTRRCFAFDLLGNAVELIEDAGEFATLGS